MMMLLKSTNLTQNETSIFNINTNVSKSCLELSSKLDPTTDASYVLSNHGEQTYAAWLARKKGIQVESWDIDMLSLIREAREHHEDKAILGWIAGMGAKHIIDRGEDLDPKHLIALILSSLELLNEDFAQEIGLDLSTSSINKAVNVYVGKDFEELTYEDAEHLATPRKRGETNDVIREMNLARDRNFLETVARYKDRFDNIVATCGKSHAITWKPALEKLYS